MINVQILLRPHQHPQHQHQLGVLKIMDGRTPPFLGLDNRTF